MISNIIQDVSRYQQLIDFAYLKSKGQNKIIIKAGSGSLSKDSKWEEHYANAILNDFSIAPYFWHDPTYDAIAQSKFFISLLEGKKVSCVVIDFEQWWQSWQKWEDWKNEKIPQSQVPIVPSEVLFEHFKTVHQALIQYLTPFGISVITYTAAWFLDAYCPQAYNYLKDYYTHWADYSLLSTDKETRTWEYLEGIAPIGKKIPTLPANYPLDKVLIWQYSGDKYKAIGVYGDVAKTKLSDLDLNLWIHQTITWENLAKNAEIIPPTNPSNPIPSGKEVMIESITRKLNVLNVPYVSQLTSGALQHNNDCGAASGVMLIKAYTDENMTVDQFYDETGMVGDAYLSATQIMNVLSKHGVGSKWVISNMNDLMLNLRSFKPLICLVLYKVLVDAGITESKFGGFHFMTVVGYDTENIYVNDPLWTTDGGNQMAIPFAIFEKAWKDAGANPILNPAYGCIVPVNPLGINIPANPKYKVTASKLNIRSGAGTSYSIIGTLSYGDIVEISSISNGWGKLVKQTGYISMAYTVKL